MTAKPVCEMIPQTYQIIQLVAAARQLAMTSQMGGTDSPVETCGQIEAILAAVAPLLTENLDTLEVCGNPKNALDF